MNFYFYNLVIINSKKYHYIVITNKIFIEVLFFEFFKKFINIIFIDYFTI
jgi:hypothetical protein